jgi:hypothetical protein
MMMLEEEAKGMMTSEEEVKKREKILEKEVEKEREMMTSEEEVEKEREIMALEEEAPQLYIRINPKEHNQKREVPNLEKTGIKARTIGLLPARLHLNPLPVLHLINNIFFMKT